MKEKVIVTFEFSWTIIAREKLDIFQYVLITAIFNI